MVPRSPGKVTGAVPLGQTVSSLCDSAIKLILRTRHHVFATLNRSPRRHRGRRCHGVVLRVQDDLHRRDQRLRRQVWRVRSTPTMTELTRSSTGKDQGKVTDR